MGLKEPWAVKLDFDFACAYRLDLYEREERRQLAKYIGRVIGRAIDQRFAEKGAEIKPEDDYLDGVC